MNEWTDYYAVHEVDGPPQWWRVALHRIKVFLFSRRWSKKDKSACG